MGIVNLRKAGARAMGLSTSGDPVIELKTVLPSEYARSDIATPQVFDIMRRTSLAFHQQQGAASTLPPLCVRDCIDTVPLIRARNWFYGPPQHIYIDKCELTSTSTYFAEAGDAIQFGLMVDDTLNESFERCFVSTISDSDTVRKKAKGKILAVWTVRHSNRKNEPDAHDSCINLSNRDEAIRKIFDFVSYTSPTDSVNVAIPNITLTEEEDPDVDDGNEEQMIARKKSELKEARKLRREALKERRRQMQDAWSNWRKPVIKPGDVVALLCPHRNIDEAGAMLTSTDKQSRVLLISRHWTENEERSTHILWVPGRTDLESFLYSGIERRNSDVQSLCMSPVVSSESANFHIYITEISLIGVHPGKRGWEAFSAVSSFGSLSTGELYAVYRFLLFWDGFEVQAGKEASGDGIYLLCLNFPASANRSSSDVRILSLTPPGVKSDAVIREIVSDVVKGMKEGFLDVDAEGNMRRIFLDLVGFVGDTPALNAFLDVLGHTSCACCHLCRYVRRSATIVGSRFTGKGTDGGRTALQRGFIQEQAIRDSSPGAETCRLMGLKFQPDNSATVLHDVRSKVMSAKECIPKTAGGFSVVPCAMDPYKACVVAPDHLLTGHARDCINLGLHFLPSRSARELCEKHMLAILESCNLPKQNRLVNHERKKLFAMSMTDLYAVSLVAYHAFSKVKDSNSWRESCSVQERKFDQSIDLVRSVGHLISELWFKPDIQRDSTLDVAYFGMEGGQKHIMKMRELLNRHVALVESICSMQDSDALQLSNTTASRVRKAELTRESFLCAQARRVVDKPNVHRLKELVYETLPMFGHVSVFGELPLEKTHQELKRAIKMSSKKNAHIQAMDSAIFGDWQGRITMVAHLAAQGNNRHILACFRLISGRESVILLKGKLRIGHKDLVMGSLNNCLLRELSIQGKYALSHRLISFSQEGSGS